MATAVTRIRPCATPNGSPPDPHVDSIDVAGRGPSRALRKRLVADLAARGLLPTKRVRDAFMAVPRERFVPVLAAELGLDAIHEDQVHVTHRDKDGQSISSFEQPALIAAMLECLQVEAGHRILEIGSGTGYTAALLAHLAGPTGHVTSIEVDGTVAEEARGHLARGRHRVQVVQGDGMLGWAGNAPYDRIVVTAQPQSLPRSWWEQLCPDGLIQVPLRIDVLRMGVGLVITFRRRPDGLVSVAHTWGQFMGFRAPGAAGAPDQPWPLLGAWTLGTGRRNTRMMVSGPALARLSKAGRGQLLALLLNGHQQRLLDIRDSAAATLLCALAGPRARLMVVRELDTEGIGLLDPSLQGFAVLLPHAPTKAGSSRMALRSYGDGGRAADELLTLVDGWRRLGAPGLNQFEFSVAFGPHPAGNQWHLPPLGECRIGARLAT